FDRHVLVHAGTAGWDGLDAIHRVLSLHDVSEYGVTPTVMTRMVQRRIVVDVDEELGGGRMGGGGTCHGNRIRLVLQAVPSLVLHCRSGRFLFHASVETAALDHKATDHTMKERAAVVATINVGKKVFHRFRCLFRIEFENN